MKHCNTCDTDKEESEFYKNPKSKDGLLYRCIECVKAKRKINNTAIMRRWRHNNHDQYLEYQRSYYKENRDWINGKRRTYNRNRAGLLSKQRKEYRQRNPERTKEKNAEQQRRALSTPKGRFNHRFRQAVVRTLKAKKGGKSWVSIVGYDLKTLMKHLEKQFSDGMTWDNYGNGAGKWNIDHIIPVSAFNFETYDDIDFKRCWALKNLQPLWAVENYRKGPRMNRQFQPCLAIGA